jgi:hypothetical protein
MLPSIRSTRSSRPRHYLVMMVVLSALLFGACVGAPPSNTVVAGQSEDSQPPTASPSENGSSMEPSDLGARAEQVATVDGYNSAMQEGIASCMDAAGIKYVPHLPPSAARTSPSINTPDEGPPKLGPMPSDDPNLARRAELPREAQAIYDATFERCFLETESELPPPSGLEFTEQP